MLLIKAHSIAAGKWEDCSCAFYFGEIVLLSTLFSLTAECVYMLGIRAVLGCYISSKVSAPFSLSFRNSSSTYSSSFGSSSAMFLLAFRWWFTRKASEASQSSLSDLDVNV